MGKLSLLLEAVLRESFFSLGQFTGVLEIPLDHCIGRTICESYRSQRWVTGGVLRKGRSTYQKQVLDPPMLHVHIYHRIGIVCTYNRTALDMSPLESVGLRPSQTRTLPDVH